MKIGIVGAELFREDREIDGRTDMTKLIVAFYYFTNAPKELNNTIKWTTLQLHTAVVLNQCQRTDILTGNFPQYIQENIGVFTSLQVTTGQDFSFLQNSGTG